MAALSQERVALIIRGKRDESLPTQVINIILQKAI